MIELNEQQRRELSAPEPVAIDPETQHTYVLVRTEVYERIKNLLGDDPEQTEELRLLLARSAAENGWNEPSMDEYDQYDVNRAKRCP